MARVFLSYVSEDRELVQRLANELTAHGVDVWLDVRELQPGDRWKYVIRESLTKADFFIACFSSSYYARQSTQMNEELTLAVDELRRRHIDRAWFISVLLDPCELPGRFIGGGEGLSDIQAVRLYEDWTKGVQSLLSTVSSVSASQSRHKQILTSTKPAISVVEEMQRDIELLMADLQVATDLYFDTNDVYQMVLGFEAFISGHSFLAQDFRSRRTLVHCIAVAGWYSTIRILPMHQEELCRLLITKARSLDSKRLAKMIRYFIESVGFSDAPPIGSVPSEDWAQFVREQVGQAEALFKCIYSIRGGIFQKRYLDLVQSSLAFDEADDLMELIDSREFKLLRAAFDDKRRHARSVNNFADAVAITYLIREIERYDRGERNAVPLFFASSPLFQEVVDQAGITTQLSPKRSDVGGTIFRSTNYLFLRAIFLSPESFGLPRDLQDVRSSLQSATQVIQEARREGHGLTFERLEEIIGDIQRFKFFENVWLHTMAVEQEAIWVDLNDLISRLEDEEFCRAVDEAVGLTLIKLENSIEQYRRASNLWDNLEKKSQWLRNNDEYTWKQALLPLGLSPAKRSKVMEGLHGISQENSDSILSVVRACLEVGEKSDVTSSLAVLWVMKMYRMAVSIVDTLPKELTQQDHSLLIIHSACLFHLERDLDAVRVRDGLEEFGQPRSDLERSRIALGLACLFFQEFLSKRKRWHSSDDGAESEGRVLLAKAIDYAQYARFTTPDESDRLFATAQYLEAKLESKEIVSSEVQEALYELDKFRAHLDLWVPRYDLIRAKYYYFRALAAQSFNEKRYMLDHAIRLTQGIKDEEVMMFYGRLLDELHRLGSTELPPL